MASPTPPCPYSPNWARNSGTQGTDYHHGAAVASTWGGPGSHAEPDALPDRAGKAQCPPQHGRCRAGGFEAKRKQKGRGRVVNA